MISAEFQKFVGLMNFQVVCSNRQDDSVCAAVYVSILDMTVAG